MTTTTAQKTTPPLSETETVLTTPATKSNEIDLSLTQKAHYESSNIRVCGICGEKAHSRINSDTGKTEKFCPIALESCTFVSS